MHKSFLLLVGTLFLVTNSFSQNQGTQPVPKAKTDTLSQLPNPKVVSNASGTQVINSPDSARTNVENAAGQDGEQTSGQAEGGQRVNQRTTSSAGSPGILAPENGRAPDGTNTVQRAKPNMAGSPVPTGDVAPNPVDANRQKMKSQHSTGAREYTTEGVSQNPAPTQNQGQVTQGQTPSNAEKAQNNSNGESVEGSQTTQTMDDPSPAQSQKKDKKKKSRKKNRDNDDRNE